MNRLMACIEPAALRQHRLSLLPHVQWIRMLCSELGLGSGDGWLLASSRRFAEPPSRRWPQRWQVAMCAASSYRTIDRSAGLPVDVLHTTLPSL